MKPKIFTLRLVSLALFAALWALMTAMPARAAVDAQAVQQTLDSEAFHAAYIQRAYETLLDRAATSSELATAKSAMQSGDKGRQSVVAQIAGSPAYFQKAGNDNARFVAQLFQDLVGRAPDDADEAPAALDFLKTDSREDLAATVADTDEFRTRAAQGVYGMFLHRAATDAEAAAGAAKLAAGGVAALAGALLASPEYFQRAGGTQSGWQKTVAQDLGGTVSDDETPGAMNTVEANATSMNDNARAPLVKAVLASAEYFAGVVRRAYGKYLHRLPTPAETQKWSAVLQNGGSSDAVMMGVLTSDEYFNRAGGTTDAFLKRLSQDLLGASNGGKNGDAISSGNLIDLLRSLPNKKKKSQPQPQ